MVTSYHHGMVTSYGDAGSQNRLNSEALKTCSSLSEFVCECMKRGELLVLHSVTEGDVP